MAQGPKIIVHAPATTQAVVAVSTAPQSVTISNPLASTARVWAGTDPHVAVYPWYGTQIAPGATAVISATPGQVVYTHSEAPSSLTVTVQ